MQGVQKSKPKRGKAEKMSMKIAFLINLKKWFLYIL